MKRPWKARRDPKVAKDGTCAHCGKPRPQIAVMHKDPFCCTACARAHHGVNL